MFGSLLGSTADADEAYASRMRARLALETEGLDADGAAVLRELRRLEADDPSSPLADADDELVHRAVLDNRVIDHERITGREGGDVLELLMVYEVEDGGIRRAWSIR